MKLFFKKNSVLDFCSEKHSLSLVLILRIFLDLRSQEEKEPF